MISVLVRKLPLEVHRALKVRAALNGRSTEAEMREILTEAVQPLKLKKIAQEVGLKKTTK